MDRADVHGYCYYEVFGPVDVIIRMWARPDSREALLKTLRETEKVIIVSHVVNTTPPRYLWDKNYDPELALGVVLEHDINALRKAQAVPTSAEADELRNEGIILRDIEQDERDKLKFFVIAHVGTHEIENILTQELVQHLQAEEDSRTSPISLISLYPGTANEYIIKATITPTRFPYILKFVRELAKAFALANITTETYLVANPEEMHQNDDVDFGARQRAPELVNMSLRWNLDQSTIDRMNESAKHVLALSYGSIEEQNEMLRIDGRGRDIFRMTFQAFITQSEYAIMEKLFFLADMERGLVSLIRNIIFPRVYNSPWDAELNRLLEALAEKEDKFASVRFGTDKWDMGCSVSLINKISKDSKVGESVLSELLGSHWHDQLLTAQRLRNSFAHYKLNPLSDFQDLIRDLRATVPLYYRIEQVLKDEVKRP